MQTFEALRQAMPLVIVILPGLHLILEGWRLQMPPAHAVLPGLQDLPQLEAGDGMEEPEGRSIRKGHAVSSIVPCPPSQATICVALFWRFDAMFTPRFQE